MPDQYRTVRRLVEVLRLVTESAAPVRLVDVATTLGIPMSSAHVLLQELTKQRMIRRLPGAEYEPGAELVALGVQLTKRLKVLDAARPVMSELMEATTQDVFLAVPTDAGMMYVERVNGPDSLRLDIPMGVPRPMHSTAIGHLYLAQQDPVTAGRLIDALELAPATPHTITSHRALRARIAQTRKAACAVTDQESVDGIMAFAAPIFDYSGRLVGALSLSVFRTVGMSRRQYLSDELGAACRAVSERLGWQQPEAGGAVAPARAARARLGARSDGQPRKRAPRAPSAGRSRHP